MHSLVLASHTIRPVVVHATRGTDMVSVGSNESAICGVPWQTQPQVLGPGRKPSAAFATIYAQGRLMAGACA